MSAIPSDLPTQPSATATDAFTELTSQEFLEIIFTELGAQDPLAPNETKDLLEQISLIRSIESDLQLSDQLESILRQNEIAASSTLVGKFVTGLTSSAIETAGFVDSVSVTREGIALNLSSGFTVELDQVSEIIDPAIIGFDGADDDAPDDADGDGDGADGG